MYHLTRCLVLGHNNCISLVWTYDSSVSWYEFEEAPNGALRHVESTPQPLAFYIWADAPASLSNPADYYFVSVSGGQPSGEGGSVDFGNYKISSNELKRRLQDFANQTGCDVTVVGGDRSAARNSSVGGSKGSRHLYGDAADIVVRGTPNRDVAIQAQGSGLLNTTIYYPSYNTPGALPPHVHVDLNPGHENVLMKLKMVQISIYHVILNV